MQEKHYIHQPVGIKNITYDLYLHLKFMTTPTDLYKTRDSNLSIHSKLWVSPQVLDYHMVVKQVIQADLFMNHAAQRTLQSAIFLPQLPCALKAEGVETQEQLWSPGIVMDVIVFKAYRTRKFSRRYVFRAVCGHVYLATSFQSTGRSHHLSLSLFLLLCITEFG